MDDLGAWARVTCVMADNPPLGLRHSSTTFTGHRRDGRPIIATDNTTDNTTNNTIDNTTDNTTDITADHTADNTADNTADKMTRPKPEPIP